MFILRDWGQMMVSQEVKRICFRMGCYLVCGMMVGTAPFAREAMAADRSTSFKAQQNPGQTKVAPLRDAGLAQSHESVEQSSVVGMSPMGDMLLEQNAPFSPYGNLEAVEKCPPVMGSSIDSALFEPAPFQGITRYDRSEEFWRQKQCAGTKQTYLFERRYVGQSFGIHGYMFELQQKLSRKSKRYQNCYPVTRRYVPPVNGNDVLALPTPKTCLYFFDGWDFYVH